MIESILIVLIGIGLGWVIGYYLAKGKLRKRYDIVFLKMEQTILQLHSKVNGLKSARQAEIQVHCQAKDAASAEIKMVKDKLTQLDDAWLKKTGHLFKFGAEDFQKPAGNIVDTKVGTGDIDQVIIEAPEGSTVKLKKDE